jgi:hypothetical protein
MIMHSGQRKALMAVERKKKHAFLSFKILKKEKALLLSCKNTNLPLPGA